MGYRAYFLALKSLTVTGKNGTQTEQYRSVKTPIASIFFTAFYVRTSVVQKRNGNFLLTRTLCHGEQSAFDVQLLKKAKSYTREKNASYNAK